LSLQFKLNSTTFATTLVTTHAIKMLSLSRSFEGIQNVDFIKKEEESLTSEDISSFEESSLEVNQFEDIDDLSEEVSEIKECKDAREVRKNAFGTLSLFTTQHEKVYRQWFHREVMIALKNQDQITKDHASEILNIIHSANLQKEFFVTFMKRKTVKCKRENCEYYMCCFNYHSVDEKLKSKQKTKLYWKVTSRVLHFLLWQSIREFDNMEEMPTSVRNYVDKWFANGKVRCSRGLDCNLGPFCSFYHTEYANEQEYQIHGHLVNVICKFYGLDQCFYFE
jgi:hypothetical protein